LSKSAFKLTVFRYDCIIANPIKKRSIFFDEEGVKVFILKNLWNRFLSGFVTC